MDGVVDVDFAIAMARLGGLAVLNLDGIQTRYADPAPIIEKIRGAAPKEVNALLKEIYREPVKPELVRTRIQAIKAAGAVCAVSSVPARASERAELVEQAGADLYVVQGTVLTARHESLAYTQLSFEELCRHLDIPVVVGNCVHYETALELMDTGVAGILVGVGPGAACTTRGVLGVGVPQVTATADVAAAREEHLRRTGFRVAVITDGGMRIGADVCKAFAAGADAVMIGSPLAAAHEAPGRGHHWGMATFHPTLPRGARVRTAVRGTIQEILVGPAHENDGRLNLFGALRTSMATCGYETVKEFQKAEVMIAPALKTEGKDLQRAQNIGMGS
jgi:IMP dehydrogenase